MDDWLEPWDYNVKDYRMTEQQRERIQDQIARHLLEAKRLERELEAYEERTMRYGEDEYVDGAVIAFDKQFTKGGTKYSYAFLKSNELWYGTGPKAPKAYSWERLVAFMSSPIPVESVWMVTDYEQIV